MNGGRSPTDTQLVSTEHAACRMPLLVCRGMPQFGIGYWQLYVTSPKQRDAV